MKHTLRNLCLSVIVLAAGCATSGLPKGSRVIGGGDNFMWMAPEDGTGILREETTKRIVTTQSLTEGTSFRFPSTFQHQEALKRFGQPMLANLKFVLYFVPSNTAKE